MVDGPERPRPGRLCFSARGGKVGDARLDRRQGGGLAVATLGNTYGITMWNWKFSLRSRWKDQPDRSDLAYGSYHGHTPILGRSHRPRVAQWVGTTA
jgi:hypothetical protein